MAEPHVISALVRKRAELAGDIEATHKRLSQMIADLEKLDATILMFDGNYQIEGIKPKAFRPPSDWSNRGEMTRTVRKILRLASEPLTTRDIALQLMSERAVDTSDQKLIRLMSKRVGVAVRRMRETGEAISTQGPGQYMLWRIGLTE
ncbi:MAG: hypothetical protein R3C42_02080 [Parvularculaceae bacterium]|nr:hypothetical protein [Parvularculaceae bacterium]